jgi:hypothetical protein
MEEELLAESFTDSVQGLVREVVCGWVCVGVCCVSGSAVAG